MNSLLALMILAYYANAKTLSENCKDFPVSINYEKETLKSNLDCPYQLAIDYKTNRLFFSYTKHEPLMLYFESAYIDLKSNEFKIIKGILDGFANAVDNEKHIVYLGGQNGIYKFDDKSERALYLEGASHSIWQLFYKHDLYYTTFPESEAYVFTNGESKRVPELLNTKAILVAIHDTGDIYFSNSTGLFVHEKDKNFKSYLGNYTINGFTSDRQGDIYFSSSRGIFYINQSNKTVEEVVLMDEIYGIAIEGNGDIIYSSQDSVVRLKPSQTHC